MDFFQVQVLKLVQHLEKILYTIYIFGPSIDIQLKRCSENIKYNLFAPEQPITSANN